MTRASALSCSIRDSYRGMRLNGDGMGYENLRPKHFPEALSAATSKTRTISIVFGMIRR